jgi:hypothetical protein
MLTDGVATAVMLLIDVSAQVMFWKVGLSTADGVAVFSVIAMVFVAIQFETGCFESTVKVPMPVVLLNTGCEPVCGGLDA